MPQDPATIQRQIEETRAELAQTIDAIVDIVSPKRVAERARVQIEAKVAEFRHKVLPPPEPAPETPLALEPGAAGGVVGEVGEAGEVVVRRAVRWDRVVIVSGMLLFVVVAGNRRRTRRRHRRSSRVRGGRSGEGRRGRSRPATPGTNN